MLVVPRLVRSGSTFGAMALTRQLRKLGWEATLATLSPESTWDPALRAALVESGVRVASAEMPGWRSALFPARFAQFVRRNAPDVVCSYNLRPDLMNAAADGSWAKVSSVRVMLPDAYRAMLGRFAGPVFERFHMRAVRRMDGVITISEGMTRSLVNRGIPTERVFYVPNFLDGDWLSEEQVVPIPPVDGRIEAAIVGKLMVHKRVDWAIRATAAVVRENPQFHLHVVGDGGQRRRLEALAHKLGCADHVEFHGRVEDVRPILKRSHFILHTSAAEGVPRALMEAMALGRTVLAPSIDGVDELVEDGESGYLFRADSLDAVSERLGWLIREQAFLPPQQVRDSLFRRFNPEVGGVATTKAFESLIIMREERGAGT